MWKKTQENVGQSRAKGSSDVGRHEGDDKGVKLLAVYCVSEDAGSSVKSWLSLHTGMSSASQYN